MSRWDADEPRRQEVRATEPRPRPQRARKNTRRWCRGKVGVDHVLATRLNKNVTYRNERGLDAPACYRAEWWKDHWWCNHEEYCVNCGKILVVSLNQACPDFTTEVTVTRESSRLRLS